MTTISERIRRITASAARYRDGDRLKFGDAWADRAAYAYLTASLATLAADLDAPPVMAVDCPYKDAPGCPIHD